MRTQKSAMTHVQKYTAEVQNLASFQSTPSTLETEIYRSDIFRSILDEVGADIIIGREYEHFLTLISRGNGDELICSNLELPHPSGFTYDIISEQLYVSSTRTPNFVTKFGLFDAETYASGILYNKNHVQELNLKFNYLIPKQASYFPGSFYIHDLLITDIGLLATITGHNFLAKLHMDGTWEKVWSPSVIDEAAEPFNQNYLQLNSIAYGGSIAKSYFTAFSNITHGYKPWKQGYGPIEKGVVFNGKGDVVFTGLTCPHSAKIFGSKLYLCNSGFGSVGYYDLASAKSEYIEIAKLPGFTRGLTVTDKYIFVATSKVIEKYEPYAPGIDAKSSQCAIYVLDRVSGIKLFEHAWDVGYQIYDVQILPGLSNSKFPQDKSNEGLNRVLRYLDV